MPRKTDAKRAQQRIARPADVTALGRRSWLRLGWLRESSVFAIRMGWMRGLVVWAGKLAWTATAVGLIGGLLAFMIEMEDRQAERIFRAWDTVASAVPTKQTEIVTGGFTTGGSNSNVGRALEYLNRSFAGWGCLEIVRGIAKLTTGDERRACVLPRKRRESLAGLQLSNMHLEGVQLSGALLKFTQLERSFLERANLSKANLSCANLGSTLLARAKLEGATLRWTRMNSANLVEASLNEADLHAAYMATTHLKAASLKGAQMGCLSVGNGAKVCTDIRGTTGLTCGQLRQARNWESAYRDEKMRCGRELPVATDADVAHAAKTPDEIRHEVTRKTRAAMSEHDFCPYERANPRVRISVQEPWLRD